MEPYPHMADRTSPPLKLLQNLLIFPTKQTAYYNIFIKNDSEAGAPVMPLLTIQHEKDKVVPIPTNSPAPEVCPTKGVYPSQMKPRVNLLKWGWRNVVILCACSRRRACLSTQNEAITNHFCSAFLLNSGILLQRN